MESSSHSSAISSLRDSAKVLQQVISMLDHLEEVLATHRLAGGTDVSGAVAAARENTLDSISEVIDNAPKHTKIVTHEASASTDAVDSYNN